MVLRWQVKVNIDVVRQEFFHSSLERVDARLLESQDHAWVHSGLVLSLHEGAWMVLPAAEESLRNEQANKQLGH